MSLKISLIILSYWEEHIHTVCPRRINTLIVLWEYWFSWDTLYRIDDLHSDTIHIRRPGKNLDKQNLLSDLRTYYCILVNHLLSFPWRFLQYQSAIQNIGIIDIYVLKYVDIILYLPLIFNNRVTFRI